MSCYCNNPNCIDNNPVEPVAPLPSSGDDAGVELPDGRGTREDWIRAVEKVYAAGRAAERKECMTAVADVDAADRCQLAMREKCAGAIAARAGGTTK